MVGIRATGRRGQSAGRAEVGKRDIQRGVWGIRDGEMAGLERERELSG